MEDKQINLNSIINNVNLLKIELKILKEHNKPTQELNNIIEELKNKNIEYNDILIELYKKVDIYQYLKNMFSNDGVRKSIIGNIIRPVNVYLSEFLKKLESSHKVSLNDEFDATVCELESVEIDPETISKGEDRKINMAIALSYLKLILKFKHTNILFLDEIFDGIDVDNVDIILKILKELAIEHNLNIICVHHNLMNLNNFTRIIKANKYIFSDIEDSLNQSM